MRRQISKNVGLVATVALVLVSGVALANPEAGGDYSQTTTPVPITSASPTAPTILRSVTLKCPAAGLLFGNADAGFRLAPSDPSLGPAALRYGISRTTAFDSSNYHEVYTTYDTIVPAGIQRFDTCTAGQTVTYRFLSYLAFNVATSSSWAYQPRLSVIFLRDRD